MMASEARLIDANKIKYHQETVCYGHGCYSTEETVSREEIDRMPTADAVEVTRCKDCEKYEPVGIRPFLGVCQEWDTVVSETGFCHHGEPKKQEGKHEADHSH